MSVVDNAQKRGSVVGGMLLIAGSCIGAGMLGLPILTGMAGFFPSLLMFSVACFFMTATSLLLVEIGQWFDKKNNFITIVTRMLGPIGKIACWLLYLFLFYALLVAYIAGSGNHVASFTNGAVPIWCGSLFFVILFGSIAYFGTRVVDLTNRFLMVVKISAFISLLALGAGFIEPSKLTYMNIKYAFFPLPILIISFGFQNMIPTLNEYLGGDTKRVRRSILGGALFTLIVYFLWSILALGVLPVKGEYGILNSYLMGIDAAQALKENLQNPLIGTAAALLAFFAILTSFLAQTLTLVHFLTDGLKVESGKRENLWICLLALIPPLVFAIFDPTVFYAALGFAGGICAVILFGILPVLMVWRGRYGFEYHHTGAYQVFGKRTLLFSLFCIASFVVFYQLSQMSGFNLFPKPTKKVEFEYKQ